MTDASRVFMIDIGPYAEKLYVSIDKVGVEISDDPILIREEKGDIL